MKSLKVFNLLLFLAILFSFALLSLFFVLSEKKLRGDAVQYYLTAHSLKSGKGFSFPGYPHKYGYDFSNYRPTMYREPVYIGIWAMFIKLTGEKPELITTEEAFPNIPSVYLLIILQVIGFFLMAWLIYKTSLLVFTPPVAWLAFFLVLLSPILINYAVMPATESIFTLQLVLSVFLLIKGLHTGKRIYFAFAGVSFGMATLCKAVTFLLPPFFVFIYLTVLLASNRNIILGASKEMFVFLLFYGIVLFPWMYRNHLMFNKFFVTIRHGTGMLIRSDKINQEWEEFKMWTVASFSEGLANRLFNRNDLKIDGGSYFNRRLLERYNVAMKSEKKFEDIDAEYMQEAIILIKKHPLKYILYTPLEFIRLNSFNIPLLNQYSSGYVMFLKGIFKLAGWMITCFVFLGLIKYLKGRQNGFLVLAVVVIYFNLIHITMHSIARYIVPAIPFYLIIISALFLQKDINPVHEEKIR